MKQITTYILEGLKITSKTRVNEKTYHPKYKNELKELIEKLLDERGKDADLNDIDTSNITDMSNLFEFLDPHNIDISQWDVSNVTDMRNMFLNSNFNQNISNWNISKVKSVYGTFSHCPIKRAYKPKK